MEFEHPYFLIFIPLFFLYFCYVWGRGKMFSKYLASSNVTVGKRKKLNVVKLCLTRLSYVFLLLSLSFGAFALARPLGAEMKEEEKVKAYSILLALDVSGSMGGGKHVGDHESIVQVVEFAKSFVLAREGDVFGLVPFEGTVVEEFVLPLTTSTDTMIKYLDDLKYFSGGSTAIGEAELRSIVIFLKKALGADANNLNSYKIRQDIENGRWDYGAGIAKITGKIENAIVIVLTDSGNNTGISPIEAIRYAYHLFGIKFYAVRENVVGDDDFVMAIEETGGKAYFVQNATATADIFNEINRIEKKEIIIGEVVSKKPLYRKYWIISLYLLSLYAISMLLIKIP